MAKIEGVSLCDVWRTMPWERKVELTETVAGLIKHLRDREFDQIGGLYFESAVKRGPSNLDDTDKSVVLVSYLAMTECTTMS